MTDTYKTSYALCNNNDDNCNTHKTGQNGELCMHIMLCHDFVFKPCKLHKQVTREQLSIYVYIYIMSMQIEYSRMHIIASVVILKLLIVLLSTSQN